MAAIAALLPSAPLNADALLSGSAQIDQALHRLANTGSVLMIAAHPDDENTALLAYFARGLCVRTGYLSMTRGEGGQNLLGPEQGDALGVIRTEELLAARRIDGAEQYFTRAIDFGFSKTAAETLEKWGRDRALSDVVRVIRRFRPDVIVLRFSGTPRDGHGQHQASAILGKEAFSAAADPKRFPDCGPPWQAKRIVWNMFAFTKEMQEETEKTPGRITVDTGAFNPVLGHSYMEIAGMSRSQHKSQGMGAPERRGTFPESMVVVAGAPAKTSIFDDVDVTWNRVPGGAHAGELINQALREYQPEHPETIVPLLAEAKRAIPEGDDPLLVRKRGDIDEAIALCAGLWVDATADKYAVVPGGKVKLTWTAVDRGPLKVVRVAAKPFELGPNKPFSDSTEATIDPATPWSQPYWLQQPKDGDSYAVADPSLIGQAENPPVFEEHLKFEIDGTPIELDRPVVYRWVDRTIGERWRPVAVVPPVAISLHEPSAIFPNAEAKRTVIEMRAVGKGAGDLRLDDSGWKIEPRSTAFNLNDGEATTAAFAIQPPTAEGIARATAEARIGNRDVNVATELIDYTHIPQTYLFPPAEMKLVRTNVKNLAKSVGYVMGAGDEVPDALRQMGSAVTLLTPDDLAMGDFSRFDAIVTGVRAYNTRPDLRANEHRLLDYVRDGGTLVVQYNTLEGNAAFMGSSMFDYLGPWTMEISHDRVTVEEAPVRFLDPASPLLHQPNEITAKDFEGWVQERGLYFASKWDPQYHTLFETHDPGEKPLMGGTLYAKYGKGAYVFTAFSWFRELPAGVPGAFRIFANLLSAGKTLQ